MAAEVVKVGTEAPDFTLPSSLGKDLSLKDLTASGRYTILYFFPQVFTSCESQHSVLPPLRSRGGLGFCPAKSPPGSRLPAAQSMYPRRNQSAWSNSQRMVRISSTLAACTLEAKAFQRDLDQYNALNAQIVGVSVDAATSQTDFKASCGLDFTRTYYSSLTRMARPGEAAHALPAT